MLRPVLSFLVLFFLSAPFAPALAGAETRVALVIGNGHYAAVNRLDNPPRDAAAVAAALKNAGFASVDIESDLTREAMIKVLQRFAVEAEQADWAVIYFAGHGLEVGGVNYLVPVDAKLAADKDVQDEAVPLDRVLSAIEGARKLKLVILDACRNDPFVTQMRRTSAGRSVGRGLGPIEPEGGTLVAYSAKHGQLALDGDGANSPFVTALVNRLREPGLEINKLFRVVRDDVLSATGKRQEPYQYGSLPGEDYFFLPPLAVPNPLPSGAQGTQTANLAPPEVAKPAPPHRRIDEPLVLTGHTYQVTSVAFSPDGARLASGSNDYTIRIWDASSGQLLRELKGNALAPNSVAFSPDGTRLASGMGLSHFENSDFTVKLWDAASGQLLRELKGDSVYSVAFSPDGARLASGSEDNTIRIWDAASGQLLRELKGHTGWGSVAFSPDGARLASGTRDDTIRVWDVASGQLLRELKGHKTTVWSVAFSPDGARLASGSADDTIRIWDAVSGQFLRELKGHSGGWGSVAFSPDGARLAANSHHNTIRIWDAASGHLQRELKGHTDSVSSVAFSPDGTRLASGSWDKTIRIWDLSDIFQARQ